MAQYGGAPNFLSVIDAYEAGSRQRERSQLYELDRKGRELAGQAMSGNQNALSELYRVDPDRGMKVQQFTQQQKKDWVQDFARQAYSADTPEKWQTMVDGYRKQGHNFDPGEDDFGNRDALISRSIDIGDQMGMDLRREEAKRAQANTDRAYNLQERGFKADQDWRATQAGLERDKLRAAGPDLVELFDKATGQPYKARWNAQTQSFDPVGGIKAPSGTQLEVGPDGSVKFNQGGKSLTESQSKDLVYLTRMSEAVPIIDQMGDKLLSFGENIGGQLPGVGNYIKSPEYQQAEQAAGQWRQGFLRKDSGATITPDETADTNRLYIPQPGDKEPVLRQKAQARRTATLAVKMGLPPAAVMEMQKNGIDLDKILKAPLPTGESSEGGAKGNRQPQAGTTRRGIKFEVGQ